MTLTIDISEKSHEAAQQISQRDGVSLSQVLENALESYRRQKFLEDTDAAFAALKQNSAAWQEELSEREIWEQTLSDGVAER